MQQMSIKKEENFAVVFPYVFNLNLNYEKI
jgi:hypothetical protein